MKIVDENPALANPNNFTGYLMTGNVTAFQSFGKHAFKQCNDNTIIQYN